MLGAHCTSAWAFKLSTSAIKFRVFPGRRLVTTDAPAASRRAASKYQWDAMATISQEDANRKPSSNSRERVQAILSDSTLSNRWDHCWKQGETPWDLGGVTPIIQDLIDNGNLPDGRAFVPGCGSGHDVLALASESRRVVGLDISETVNEKAKQLAAENPKGKWVEFLVADFFEFAPDVRFNLIFDYTFFCAIDPILRPAWAARMAELLTTDGELITLMFPLVEFEGGPPFTVSERIYEEVLSPHGFTMVSCEDNKLAVGHRKGQEKIAHWRKSSSKI